MRYGILKKVFKTRKTTDLTKAGLIITGVFSILLALILPSPIEIVFRTASVAVPGLIVPLIIAYNSKLKLIPRFVPVMMLVSSALAFLWLMLQSYGLASYPILQIEPMLAGLLVSLVLALAAVCRG